MVADSRTEGEAASAVIQRLVAATPGKSVAALAAILGVSHQAIYNSKNKKKVPKSWIIDVAERTGASADWLLRGGERAGTAGPPGEQAPACEVVLVPKIKPHLGAVDKDLASSAEKGRRFAFRADYLARKGRPDDMVLMDMAGDSMAPEIRSGDMLLIDRGQNQIVPGGVFAVAIDEDVAIKHVERTPGKIVLWSRNKDFPAIEVDLRGGLSGSIRIIGRVLWWCREAK